ncbi:hypothetical protein ACJX0J_016398, partial [Zea mays]
KTNFVDIKSKNHKNLIAPDKNLSLFGKLVNPHVLYNSYYYTIIVVEGNIAVESIMDWFLLVFSLIVLSSLLGIALHFGMWKVVGMSGLTCMITIILSLLIDFVLPMFYPVSPFSEFAMWDVEGEEDEGEEYMLVLDFVLALLRSERKELKVLCQKILSVLPMTVNFDLVVFIFLYYVLLVVPVQFWICF